MELFSKNNGGLMDAIRCDKQDYLIWKWRPGTESSKKENAIRWGSSLRVKDGEVAIFVYKQKSGITQEAIVGPYDEILKTENLPIISGIIGLAYAGNTPFQAEVYFINMASVIQIPFTIPYFDVYDPRFTNFSCPIAAHGKMTFHIDDYQKFIKLHRLIGFSLEQFTEQVTDGIKKYAKSFIGNAPIQYNFPVVQIERFILELSDAMKESLAPEMLEDFGITLSRIDLSSINCDKESDEYQKLWKLTGKQEAKQVTFGINMGLLKSAVTDINGLHDNRKRSKIERKIFAKRENLKIEQDYMASNIIKARTGGILQKLGFGAKYANERIESDIKVAQLIKDNLSSQNYHIAINGEQKGPFTIETIKEMAHTGLINSAAYFWQEGMSEWKHSAEIPELSFLFAPSMPATPPVPPQQ